MLKDDDHHHQGLHCDDTACSSHCCAFKRRIDHSFHGALILLVLLASLAAAESFVWHHHHPSLLSTSPSSFPFKHSFPRDESCIMTSQSNHNNDNAIHSNVKLLGVCGGIGSGKSAACRLLVSDLNCLAHIDADTVAHEVYRPGSVVLDQIAQAFGSHLLIPIPDDESAVLATTIHNHDDDTNNNSSGSSSSNKCMMLDRKKLGSIVFADAQAMSKLEQIVWPHVREELLRRIDDLKKQHIGTTPSSNDGNGVDDTNIIINRRRIIVIEAAVLLDAGWEDMMDGVWLVTASRDTAMQRLTEQRGLTPQDAEQRIQAQQRRRIAEANVPSLLQRGVVTAVIENNGSLEELKEQLEHALEDTKSWKTMPSS